MSFEYWEIFTVKLKKSAETSISQGESQKWPIEKALCDSGKTNFDRWKPVTWEAWVKQLSALNVWPVFDLIFLISSPQIQLQTLQNFTIHLWSLQKEKPQLVLL